MNKVEEKSALIAQKVKELPPLPIVVQKLLGVVGDEQSSANDVSSVLRGDQALAGKVLRLVNSSFYGLPGKVSTISRAVVILGNSAIRNLALGLAVCNSLKQLKGPIDWEAFWRHTLSCAIGAQVLAPKVGYDEPEEAFIGGLLHDIGHLVCYVALPDVYSNVITKCRGDLLESERRIFGVTHPEVGRNLMEHWQLPNPLCQMVRFHHNHKMAGAEGQKLLATVALGDVLACVGGNAFIEHHEIDRFRDLCKSLHLRMTDCGDLFETINTKLQDVKEFFEITDQASVLQGGKSEFDGSITINVISVEDERRNWLNSVIRNFGFNTVDLPALVDYQSGTAQVTLLDLQSLKVPMTKLQNFVQSAVEPTGIILNSEAMDVKLPRILAKLPRIPFGISKQHIIDLAQEGGRTDG